MKMTAGGTPAQFGGWLEETTGTARAGRTVVVKNGTSIIGMYAAEDNGVNEGYGYSPGGFRVAVPDCTTCGYTIETWDLALPGTAVGTINTMGSAGCPNTVTAATITSLNSCTTPTSITLKSLSTRITPQTDFILTLAALLSITAIVGIIFRRRSRAL
jgi:hypothetical protein